MFKSVSVLSLFLVCFSGYAAAASSMDESIHQLQKEWAIANYETAKDNQDKVFETLTVKAEKLVTANPDSAEALIWNAIIVSSHAGATGGLGALGKVKKAKKLLDKAEKINPDALHGSIYTSMGSLYYQVPGWPIGFGDDDKAEAYLKKALVLNPAGIDPNYFYGDFLRDQGRYDESEVYLLKALRAPARPDRPLADKGRKGDIQRALKNVKEELKG
jgi:tetratricopeptide (TPR) repeat protein